MIQIIVGIDDKQLSYSLYRQKGLPSLEVALFNGRKVAAVTAVIVLLVLAWDIRAVEAWVLKKY